MTLMETVAALGLEYWHWLLAGLFLLVVEVSFAGGTYLMWLGLAALVTGVLSLLLGVLLPWQLQLVVFGVLSVASVLLWRRYARDADTENAPVLNQRGYHHLGRVVLLEEPIVGGRGRVRIDDTLWVVCGSDAPAGTQVKIISQDGNLFHVERADSSN